MELKDEPGDQPLDPMSRILNAALDLAREEAAGQVLAEDEKAAVDLCDEIGGVGDTAAFERQKEGLSD